MGKTHIVAFINSEGVVRPVVERISGTEVNDPSCEVRISDLAGQMIDIFPCWMKDLDQ